MAYGFKLEDPSGTTATGEYGTSSYGTESYGGSTQISTYVLPTVEEGSDDPEADLHWFVGEIVHRRSGIVVGARKYAERRLWGFNYHQLLPTDLQGFLVYFRARRFKFLQDVTDETQFILVRWIESQFRPRQRRGGFFKLRFTIEEVV